MIFSGKAITVKNIEDGIAELNFDLQGESINKFNQLTVNELSAALDAIEADKSITGLLVTSAKKVFSVGADIGEFLPLFEQIAENPELLSNQHIESLNRLEDSDIPVVVAINGVAVGGALEFCLACDYRIANTAARLGLPEVKLGIMPGWGGSVRLPRLVGADTAIEWIAPGKEHKADIARKAGVVDAVVGDEQLVDTALGVLKQCINDELDWRERRQQKKAPLQLSQTEATMVFETSKAYVAGLSGPHYPAPIKAIGCMQQSASMTRDEALQIERQGIVELCQTEVAKSLVGLFLNDQEVSRKARDWEAKCESKVNRAAVLGAGIMGGGIAYQSALKGIPIKMKDIAQSGLDLGLAEANKLLSKRVSRGRMSVNDMGQTLSRITPTLSYDNFDAVDIVVEAVVENPKIKCSVLTELEQHVDDNAIIASNTSTISISFLAESLSRPENFCGMHFFNPVHAMPLVEVIRGEKTSDQTVARTVAYANAMGKKAIVVNDCPGFLVNRVLFPYFGGFARLLHDGADFQQIDKVMEAWGWPMGPAYLSDVVGLDTAVHAEKIMADGFPDRMAKTFTSATDILAEHKRYGQKTNGGFYDYELDKRGKLQKVNSPLANDLIASVSEAKQTFSDEDIIMRMMLPMATELARCLEEGVTGSAAEADMALIYGLGFPAFRGGVFRWIDSMGIDKLLAASETFSHLGKAYEATPGQHEMVANKHSYYA